MKTLTESINTNLMEGRGEAWKVIRGFGGFGSLANFTADMGAEFLWIYTEGNCLAIISEDEVISAFEDEGFDDDIKEIEKLKVGECYSPDGMNMYLRIHK